MLCNPTPRSCRALDLRDLVVVVEGRTNSVGETMVAETENVLKKIESLEMMVRQGKMKGEIDGIERMKEQQRKEQEAWNKKARNWKR